MAVYHLTKKAEEDLSKIFEYSVETFGLEIAQDYFQSLVKSFELIAENPKIGRPIENVLENCRRFEHKKHSIYYKFSEDYNVDIIRILGGVMDPPNHLIEPT